MIIINFDLCFVNKYSKQLIKLEQYKTTLWLLITHALLHNINTHFIVDLL